MRTDKRVLLLQYLLLPSFFVLYATPVHAATTEEVYTKIIQLQAQIEDLRGQLVRLQMTHEWCHDFNTNLRFGDSGAEVFALQTTLQKEGFDVGDEIKRQYFGEKTVSAVIKLQEMYAVEILGFWGLDFGTGFVGLKTKEQLNKLYGCSQQSFLESASSIALLSPNGGENLTVGETYRIHWRSNGMDSVKIYIFPLLGGRSASITPQDVVLSAKEGYYDWNIPQLSDLPVSWNNAFHMRIEGTTDATFSDQSDYYFRINEPPTVSGLSIALSKNSPSSRGIARGEKHDFLVFDLINELEESVVVKGMAVALRHSRSATARAEDFGEIEWKLENRVIGISRFGTVGSADGFAALEKNWWDNLVILEPHSSTTITVSGLVKSNAPVGSTAYFGVMQDFYIMRERGTEITGFPVEGNLMTIISETQ